VDIKSLSNIDYDSIALTDEVIKILKTFIWVEIYDPNDHTMPRDYQDDLYQELLDQIYNCVYINKGKFNVY